MTCICGDAEEDHKPNGGECEIEGCDCACYEEDEEGAP